MVAQIYICGHRPQEVSTLEAQAEKKNKKEKKYNE